MAVAKEWGTQATTTKTYKMFWIKIALENKLKNIVNMTVRQTNLPSISCLHLQGFSAFRTVNHMNILWNVGDPKKDHAQHVPTMQFKITNTCGYQGFSNFDPNIPRPSKTPHWPHDAHISLTVLLWIISLVNFCKHGILRLRLSWDIPSKSSDSFVGCLDTPKNKCDKILLFIRIEAEPISGQIQV